MKTEKIKAAPGPNGTPPHPTPTPKLFFTKIEFRPRDPSHWNRAEILCRGVWSVCQMEPYVSRNNRFRVRDIQGILFYMPPGQRHIIKNSKKYWTGGI